MTEFAYRLKTAHFIGCRGGLKRLQLTGTSQANAGSCSRLPATTGEGMVTLPHYSDRLRASWKLDVIVRPHDGDLVFCPVLGYPCISTVLPSPKSSSAITFGSWP